MVVDWQSEAFTWVYFDSIYPTAVGTWYITFLKKKCKLLSNTRVFVLPRSLLYCIRECKKKCQ